MSAVLKLNEQQHHQFVIKASSSNLPEGQIWFVGSKEVEDRDTDIIRVRGIKTTAFEANPVFLWAHDQSVPPIGKILKIETDADEMKFLVQFDLKDPLAALVYEKYVDGFLNAVSIGFMAFSEGVKQRSGGGFEFVESELLELSAVPVPSNREALAFARQFAAYTEHPAVAKWVQDLGGKLEEKRVEFSDETKDGVSELFEVLDAGMANIRTALSATELSVGEQVQLQGAFSTVYGALYYLQDLSYGYTYMLGASGAIAKSNRAAVEEHFERNVLPVLHQNLERWKAGRVLSATNFGKLSTAHEEIGAVLESATKTEEDKAFETEEIVEALTDEDPEQFELILNDDDREEEVDEVLVYSFAD